ncbi:Ubiquitin domain-containing protein 2 [Rhizophlyctis rosea]|uniref:Ubiquitin domain-containing protein 2 n=1 Tax=Rhizophlyctis rosea TaxID=64517 RepID=A0AAD5X2Z4_9FUNG|nr:Ubiquitin domain-containing protein 2 [Rhizophlyctis rosea]
MTREELISKREAFWDTAPSYSGREEVWAALRLCCEAETLDVSQSILDTTNIILPTGNLADGCYDELGNQYKIPIYCYVEPKNLIEASTSKSTTTLTTLENKPNAESQPTSSNEPQFTLIARLSTGSDLKLNSSTNTTMKHLKDQVLEKSNLNNDAGNKVRLRVFHLGKQLEDNLTVGKAGLGDGDLIQVMVSVLPQ